MHKPIYRLNTSEKKIALTFDDGPDPINTPLILDLLDQYKISATFFLIGQKLKQYPELARELVARGHAIGNHSYSHGWKMLFCHKTFEKELQLSQLTFEEILKIRPSLFRPPRGLWTPCMLKKAETFGLQTVMWSLMPGDYWSWHSAERIQKKVLQKIRGGDILVFHDGLNQQAQGLRSATLQALKVLIPVLKDRGYSFVAI